MIIMQSLHNLFSNVYFQNDLGQYTREYGYFNVIMRWKLVKGVLRNNISFSTSNKIDDGIWDVNWLEWEPGPVQV